MLTFKDQVVFVSGASGGIGGAIATKFAGLGATVCLMGRNIAKLEALAQQLRTTAPRVELCAADLKIDDDIERVTDWVSSTFNRLDILVHSAGAISHGKWEEAPVVDLDRQYAANVRGPYLLTQSLLPLLKRPRGQIVFINSSVGLQARSTVGQFSATQHAFKALADALREEVNADSVRVLSVYPGRTATPRIEALHAKEGRPYQPELLLQPNDVASIIISALSLPWTAEVTNISIRPMMKSY